jgi:hypothetical protein
MRIINYFESDNKDHWLSEIRKADWGAAEFLYEKYGCEFMTEMKDMDGELSRIYVKKIKDAD